MSTLTYLDSGVLIAIAEGEASIAELALEVLDDPENPRQIALSEAVRLEVMPIRLRNAKKAHQIAAVKEIFDRAAKVVAEFGPAVWKRALDEATKYDMRAMDALHVAAAIEAGAEELLTTEGPQKPICQTNSIRVCSLKKGPG